MTHTLDFWFEFGSTYSYLTAMRISEAAAARGVAVRWRPFLLGPIFAAQGWDTSPFNIYKAKGEYMWRDMARRAARYGLPFQRPPETGPGAFPQNGLMAARMALIGLDANWGEAFCRNVYSAQFAHGQDIADVALLERLADKLGIGAGETDKDGRFTLRPVRCLGLCALSPSMRIDGESFGRLTPDRLPRILERFE